MELGLSFNRETSVEALDVESGIWRRAVIAEAGEQECVVHYEGWSRKFDEKVPLCRIRQNTPKLTNKRKRRKPARVGQCFTAANVDLDPCYMVKDDKFVFCENGKLVKATVVINDPFKREVQATISTNDKDELLHVNYDDIGTKGEHVNEVNVNGESTTKRKQQDVSGKRVRKKHSKTRGKYARFRKERSTPDGEPRKSHLPNSCSNSNAHFEVACQSKLNDMTQICVGDCIVSCGDFLETEESEIFHFIDTLTVQENGRCEASGHIIRRIGDRKILQSGRFSRILENPKHAKVALDSVWRERIRSTQLAAEERMRQQGGVSCRDIEQRRCTLRRSIGRQLERGLAGKKRLVKFSIPYDNRVDGDLFGLNARNGFREEYSPESFATLDRLLGKQWDCKTLKGTDRYAYVHQISFRLIPMTQEIEIICKLISQSVLNWRVEYREDTLRQTIYTSNLFES